MKFRKFGRIALALAVSLGTGLGVTSCQTDFTAGYLWVTGSQYNQIGGFRIDNNLGQLVPNPGSPYGSGGVNPIRAVVANAGRFLYVLNAGCGGTSQIVCPSGTTPAQAGANISLFLIGGKGSLSFQQSYTSQGSLPVSIATDASGKFLFVLDSLAPSTANCIGYVAGNPASACGDITAFNIDSNTGRLSLITNQTIRTPSPEAISPSSPSGAARSTLRSTIAPLSTPSRRAAERGRIPCRPYLYMHLPTAPVNSR